MGLRPPDPPRTPPGRGLLALALLALALLAPARAGAAPGWPMFRHDPAHSGRAGVPGPAAPTLVDGWPVAIGGYYDQTSSPAIGADGTIYVGSGDGRLHA
jgi:hypothetical protein